MHRLHSALLVVAAGLIAAPALAQTDASAAQPAAKERPERKAIYDEKAGARAQIAGALAKARLENRRVLVQWGANWCGWCHLLHDKFEKDSKVRRKLMYEYDVVLVDIGRFDKHMDLAAQYGADLKGNGVPFLTVLDADGKVLANQETSSLEAPTPEGKPGHDGEKVLAFLTSHQAPYLHAETVLEKGLAAAKAGDKSVFLHFGAPWCGWCHRLEAWMAREDIAPVLERDFVDVKIDLDRMEGSKSVLARYNTKGATGIPWFALLSPSGEAIVTSDGPKGNVGCPYEDHEIAWFLEMLRKAARTLTAAEIERLGATLAEARTKKSGG